MVPCYNEEENVVPISKALVEQMEALPQYDYEIVFIDNCSQDNTRMLLRGICADNKKIRAIFNTKNFGQFNSPYYGLCQTTGDCTISVCCDFQDPIEMIPKFLEEWENGYKIVIRNTTFTSVSNFKAWLSEHNTNVYYILATENLIDLNYTVDIKLFKGDNAITNSEDAYMIHKYY